MDTALSGAPQPWANWLPTGRVEEPFGAVAEGDACAQLMVGRGG
jgi:hypothetical protein